MRERYASYSGPNASDSAASSKLSAAGIFRTHAAGVQTCSAWPVRTRAF